MNNGEHSRPPRPPSGSRPFNSRLRHSNQPYLRARQSDSDHPPISRRIAFVLLEHFSMMAFTGAVDAIVTANLLSRNPLYRFQAISLAGSAVLSDLGISIAADAELQALDATELDMLIVCGGYRSDLDPPRAVLDRPMPVLEGSAALPDALRAILKLMESNIEEPLPIDDLAHYAQVSRHQIDRLFHRYMKSTPSRYYLELRITRAHRLLLQTNAPITSIAIACGFTGAPHFSRCYRDFFGVSPSKARSARHL